MRRKKAVLEISHFACWTSRPAPKSTSAAAARECGAATACRCTRTTIKLLPLVWRAETGAEEAVEPAAAHESCCCRPSIRTAPQRTRARSPPHAASPTRVWRLENARCAPAGDGAPCNVCGGDRGFVSQDQRRPRPIAPPPRCPTPSRCAWHHSRTWQDGSPARKSSGTLAARAGVPCSAAIVPVAQL